MVSIKKNNKGEPQVVTGVRSRASSIYTPGQNSTFKISRSKFSDFLDCPRCFYLDRVKGLQSPSMPGWALNTTVEKYEKSHSYSLCSKRSGAVSRSQVRGMDRSL